MGLGPIVAATGIALLTRLDATVDYWTDVLPALLVFSLGLAATVAPLTATVLADADESNAGIASGVNNAVARVASLVAVAALGAIVSASFSSSIDSALADRRLSPAAERSVAQAKRQTLARADVSGVPPRERPVVATAVLDASVHAFRIGMGLSAGLVCLGGILGLAGIVNPRRRVRCEDCAGGQLAGQPVDAGSGRLPVLRLPKGEGRPLPSAS
jgi:hypothetical protein